MKYDMRIEVRTRSLIDELNRSCLNELIPSGYIASDIRRRGDGSWEIYLMKKKYPATKHDANITVGGKKFAVTMTPSRPTGPTGNAERIL